MFLTDFNKSEILNKGWTGYSLKSGEDWIYECNGERMLGGYKIPLD
jgi:hypothetical protein